MCSFTRRGGADGEESLLEGRSWLHFEVAGSFPWGIGGLFGPGIYSRFSGGAPQNVPFQNHAFLCVIDVELVDQRNPT